MPLILQGATSGQATLQATDAQTVTITMPATSGTLVTTGGAQTIEFADGSASAPSITNSGDTNTGMFFPAADTIAFTEGGTESMRIDSSGNLGIGTTSPVNKLQIGATSDTAMALSNSSSVTSGNRGTISMFNSGTSTVGYIRFGAVTDNVGTDMQFAVRPAGGSITEAMRIDSVGNVGIGTTNPNSGASGGITRILNLRTGSTAGTSSLTFGDAQAVATVEAMNGGSCVLNINAGGAITFGTNAPTERMRIDSSGRLLISTTATTPGYFNTSTGTQIQGGAIFTSSTGGSAFANPTSGGGVLMSFGTGNNWNTGTISTNNSNTSYNTSSDYRLKENIAPMTGALAKVAALKPCTYTWKADGSNGEGFIAHELAEVVPDAVTGEKDAMRTQQYEVSPAIPATYDEEGNELTPAVEAVMGEREVPDYQGIDTSFLVATLTAAIQELKATVDAQAARIAALEGAA